MARKSEEIKLRVTPDEKARWTSEALAEGKPLSELIRETMNDATDGEQEVTEVHTKWSGGTLDNVLSSGASAGVVTYSPVVPTSTFKKHKCPHGLPSFAYCKKCKT